MSNACHVIGLHNSRTTKHCERGGETWDDPSTHGTSRADRISPERQATDGLQPRCLEIGAR